MKKPATFTFTKSLLLCLWTRKMGDENWFGLSGRRITQPVQKGIYIVDGKKIVVK
jgi:hypothetical protein